MTDDNKKIITVSYVVAGMLIGLIAHLLLQFLAASFSSVARIESNEVLSNGIPVLLGLVTFLTLQFNKQSVDFADGVVNELKKVVWPSRRDTGLMTVVVVITLILTGIVVGAYDAIAAYLVGWVIK